MLGFQTVEQFKKHPQIYEVLNSRECSHEVLVNRIRGKRKFVKNNYIVKKKTFEIIISKTEVFWELADKCGSNIEEFFDIIDW